MDEKDKKGRRKKVINTDTGEIYPSVSAVAREYGTGTNALFKHLRGKTKTYKGYVWDRLGEENDQILDRKLERIYYELLGFKEILKTFDKEVDRMIKKYFSNEEQKWS